MIIFATYEVKNDSGLSMSIPVPQTNENSWKKVLLWAFLFYLVWNWKGMVLVYSQGVFSGPDDFMRLHQVQNWIAGQGWFDLRAHRMYPSVGADIHWTRLVDVPIAAIAGFFNYFTGLVASSRIAAIVWPFILFMLAVTSMIAICERLAGKESRLLALFFFVLSINTLAEFKPGRLDHHNVQILLLILILLGVARGLGKYSNYFVGGFIAFSITVGLDSIIPIIGVLGYITLEWLFQKPGSMNRFLQTGIAISISSIGLYVASFPAERWFSNNSCDGFSLVFLSALLLVSAALVILALISNRTLLNGKNAFVFRLTSGGFLFAVIMILLFSLFPHCLDGPLGTVGQELQTRWLDKISEAKGLIDRYPENPAYWIAQAIFLSIMLSVTALVLIKKVTKKSELAVLGFVVFICILGTFYQTRILRTGLYSVIPFCVIFASMSWKWLEQNFAHKKVMQYVGQGMICLIMTSTFWVTIGTATSFFTNKSGNLGVSETAKSDQPEEIIACTSELAFGELQNYKNSHIISDLNTAPAVLVHTKHSVEAGSYHRNGASILNVLSFFEGSTRQAKQIADDRAADFVVICHEDIPQKLADEGLTVATAIGTNQLPKWLEWVSKPDSSLAVLKVVR